MTSTVSPEMLSFLAGESGSAEWNIQAGPRSMVSFAGHMRKGGGTVRAVVNADGLVEIDHRLMLETKFKPDKEVRLHNIDAPLGFIEVADRMRIELLSQYYGFEPAIGGIDLREFSRALVPCFVADNKFDMELFTKILFQALMPLAVDSVRRREVVNAQAQFLVDDGKRDLATDCLNNAAANDSSKWDVAFENMRDAADAAILFAVSPAAANDMKGLIRAVLSSTDQSWRDEMCASLFYSGKSKHHDDLKYAFRFKRWSLKSLSDVNSHWLKESDKAELYAFRADGKLFGLGSYSLFVPNLAEIMSKFFIAMAWLEEGRLRPEDVQRRAEALTKELSEQRKPVLQKSEAKPQERLHPRAESADAASRFEETKQEAQASIAHGNSSAADYTVTKMLKAWAKNNALPSQYGMESFTQTENTLERLTKSYDSVSFKEDIEKSENGWYSNKGSNKWGRALIVQHPLPKWQPAKIRGRTHRASERGQVLRNPHRWTSDKRVFSAKLGGVSGTVLIDVSGSMSLSQEDIHNIIRMFPGGTIALYSGGMIVYELGKEPNATGKHNEWAQQFDGVVTIVAKNSRMCKPENVGFIPESVMPVKGSRIRMGGNNIIDGPALDWLAKQRGPRIWVSDGIATWFGETRIAMIEAALIADKNKIVRIDGVHQLLQLKDDIGNPATFYKRALQMQRKDAL